MRQQFYTPHIKGWIDRLGGCPVASSRPSFSGHNFGEQQAEYHKLVISQHPRAVFMSAYLLLVHPQQQQRAGHVSCGAPIPNF